MAGNGIPLIYGSGGQINALVPAAVTGTGLVGSGTVDVVVTYGDSASPADGFCSQFSRLNASPTRATK